MVPAIRNPLHVDPNDSLRSLVVRACRRRHLPHTWIIGERVGLASRNRANFAHSPDLDAVELARLLEVDVEVVTSRRHETAANGRVNYWGLAVPTLLVELNQRRRFAPGAFGAGVPMPVHDTRWDMRLLPFCPTTWQMLETQCGCCGREQAWTVANGVDRCDSLTCVQSLSKTPAREVPIELRDSLSLAAGLCAPSPEARQAARSRLTMIEDVSDQQAFDLLVVLTSLVKGAKYGGSRISGPGIDQEQLLGSVSMASEIMLAWPGGLARIDSDARLLPPSQRLAFLQQVAAMRNDEAMRNLPSDVVEALMAAIRPSHSPTSESRRVVSAGAPKGHHEQIVALRPAAYAARLNRRTMETAWNDGLVTQLQRRHGERIAPAFIMHEAMEIGEAIRARVSASGAADQLGLPLYALEQLLSTPNMIEARGIRLSSDWDLHFLRDDDLRDFRARIVGASSDLPDDQVLLHRALGAIPGRKPWGPAISRLLTDLPFHVKDGSRPLFQRICIGRSDSQQLRALTFNYAAAARPFSTQLVLGDALEILNLAWKYNAIAFSKPIVGCGPKRMSMVDVLDLAATYVSTAELMARTGSSQIRISDILKAVGLVQPFPGCWVRSSAERELSLESRRDPPRR